MTDPGDAPALPDVSALVLEDIVVQAPRPQVPSEVEILRRLAEKARAAAEVTPRSVGDTPAPTDEIVADLVLRDDQGAPLAGGALIHQRLWARHPTLGFLVQALKGVKVGDTVERAATFPADYPVAEQRGQAITVRARVRAAELITPPDLEDPAVLKALGLGGSMTEAVQTVADDLMVEAEVDAATAAREAVFDALLAAIPDSVDEAWIDAGLTAAFEARAQGALQELAPDLQQDLRKAFLADRLARDVEARKIRVTRILQALVVRDGVTLTAEAVKFATVQLATMMQLGFAEVAALVKADPDVDHQVTNLAMQLVAIGHVLDKVTVKGAPKKLSALSVRFL